MKLLETGYDKILKSDFELYSIQYGELKEMVNSWYSNVDLLEFNTRESTNERWNYEYNQHKVTGLICNLFYASKDSNDKFYLLDGFNRLLSDYNHNFEELNDYPVYLKVLIDENQDDTFWMNIMFRLNMWKLIGAQYKITSFFDRGMRLFLWSKFNIKISGEYRNIDDFDILTQYLSCYSLTTDNWISSYSDMVKKFKNPMIIEDIRMLLSSTNKEDFNHYNKFLSVFSSFLANERLKGNYDEINIDIYINRLKESTFFKKLIKMSGNDSTRKNIVNWLEL